MKKQINVSSGDLQVPAYLSSPDGPSLGGIILIHEVWGLNDHTKNVADRFSELGYSVLAPDLLSETDISEKVTPELQEALFDPKRRNQIQPKLRELMTPLQAPDFGAKTMAKLKDCFNYIYEMPELNQKVAIIGFCFGGTYSFNLAAQEERLKLAVPFYGHCDLSVEELSNIKGPVLAFYGENDEGLISKLDDLKQRMSEAKVDFTAQVYPDCGHAFFNDTNSFAYNEKAAKDAWQKTVDFLAKNF
jgi:carboxymethylenebutenolidase